ncbi:hypothetical protein M408DRAFT_20833 [Serendipita vermifera MAFF 305830]|uniref:2,5-diamino-6-ribosylamino-4(3H)-pyrimidinone 5'-phosphate reductase n=1 Tax=Serendipita vermifera MAFF 305830 TaxID=933852 RepID=A0A0C2XRU0_SERVB|nr:hypothetical protein M408DRAFT_20833 [Serendipita vermifera MAFF 305830]
MPVDCKLLENAVAGRGKAPILFCGPPAIDHEMAERMFALMDRGATVITLPLDDAGRLSLEDVCDSLFARGYRSIMIEGGQSVISSCLSPPTLALINKVIITIAPVVVGSTGMSVSGSETEQMKRLKLTASGSLESDLIAAYDVLDAS